MAAEIKYYLIGYDKREYKNKEGADRVGYNIYITERCSIGYKFLLKFDNSRRSNSPYFISAESFSRLGMDRIERLPAGIKEIYFDKYGNLGSIDFIN